MITVVLNSVGFGGGASVYDVDSVGGVGSGGGAFFGGGAIVFFNLSANDVPVCGVS